MAALTRIRNNQVYNSDINASAKIVPGSITGGLFAPAITYTGNLTVSNLFVYGNTSSLDTISVVSSDPTIILNRNFSGSNTYDVGLILGRGNQTNTAMLWNESNKEFAFIYTSATTAESYYGTVPNAGYANVHAYGGLFNNITSTTSTITNLISGNARITNGYLDNTVIGANTPNSAVVTTLNATGTANFAGTLTAATINALNIGNTGATITGTHNGPLNGPFNGTVGATTANTGVFTTLTATTGYQGAVNGAMNGTIGATTANTGAFTTLSTTGALSLATGVTGDIVTLGNSFGIIQATSSYVGIKTGATADLRLTNLTESGSILLYNSSGNTRITSTTTSTASSTGALTVAGGLGVTGNVYVSGGINGIIGNGTASAGTFTTLTSTNNTYLSTSAGNVGIGTSSPEFKLDVNLRDSTTDYLKIYHPTSGYNAGLLLRSANDGNADIYQTGTVTVIRNLTPAGNMGFAIQTGGKFTWGWSGAQYGSWTTRGLGINLNDDAQAALHVAGNVIAYFNGPIGANTANTGVFTTLTATSGYSGATNGAHNGTVGATTANTGTFTTLTATTGYQGNISGAHNGTVGASTPNVGTFTTLTINDATNATSMSSGALQITNGGASIQKDLWVGGNIYGNITSQVSTILGINDPLIYLNASNPANYNYEIGFYSHMFTGAANVYGHSGFIRNHVDNVWYLFSNIDTEPAAGSVNFSSANLIYDGLKLGTLTVANNKPSTTTTTGALTVAGGAGVVGNLNVGGIINGAFNGTVGATTTSTGAFTTITTSSTINSTGTIYAVNGVQGPLDGPFNGTIGAATPNTGVFTTVTTVSGGQLTGYHTGPIGANVANTAAFTTVVASGNIFANSGTASTGISTGALVVRGGIGASGNLNIGTYNTSLHNIQGNLLIGQGSIQASADNLLTLNYNTDAPLFSNATLHISGSTNKSTSISIDSFGTNSASNYVGRASRGTPSAPSALQKDDDIVTFSGRGYGATGFTYGNAFSSSGMRVIAAENFTDTAQGTNVSIYVNAIGSVVTGPPAVTISSTGTLYAMRSTASAGLTTGAFISNGGAAITGTLNVGNGINLFGNGNIIASTANASLFNTPTTISAFANASAISLGNTAGTLTLNNPVVVGSQITQDLFNTFATTLNFAGAANSLNIGNPTGVATINSGVYFANSTDASSSTYGSVIATGGIAIAKSANIGGNIYSGSTGTFAGNLTSPNVNGTTSVNSPVARTNVINAYANANISINPAANGNLVVNGNGVVANLIVNGSGYNNLLVTNGATGQVGVKISPDLIPNYTSFQVNATDSIMIPVGLTGSRPPVGQEQKGMLRFNSSTNFMEYWDGANWNSGGAVFTVITADEFVGNGSQTNFTLSQNTTTSGVIVSVNGLVQLPSVAYSVSGKILTFTSPPAGSAYIDIRTIVTTVSVTSIADGTTEVTVANSQPSIYATVQGSNVWVANTSTYFSGGITSFNSNTSLTQNTLTTVDTFSKTKFRSAKYIVTISDFAGAKYQTAEVLVVHNGTTATAATYGIVSTSGSIFVTYGAVISGSNVLLQANSSSTTSYASVQQIYNAI